MRHPSFGLLVALMTLLSGVATACGIQADDAPRSLAANEVPYDLLGESPRATVTTTPSPSVEQVNVAVYFVVGERLQPAPRAVTDPATPTRAINALFAGPTDEEAVNGLRTAINPTTTASLSRAANIVTVDLTADFADVPVTEQRLALGQIVFTATGIESIEGVRFTVAGNAVGVPLPDGSVTSEPVDREAFPSIAPDLTPAPA